MRRAEIVTAFLLGIFSVYLMWKSGDPPAWNPSIPRFSNIGFENRDSWKRFLALLARFHHADLYHLDWYQLGVKEITTICIRRAIS